MFCTKHVDVSSPEGVLSTLRPHDEVTMVMRTFDAVMSHLLMTFDPVMNHLVMTFDPLITRTRPPVEKLPDDRPGLRPPPDRCQTDRC